MPASNPFDFNNWFQNDGDNWPPASTSVCGRDDFHGPYRVERYLRGSTPDLSVVPPTHPIQQLDAAVVGVDEDSSTVEAPAIPRLKEIIAKAIGKSMWMPRRAARTMSTKPQRTCPSCSNEFSGAMEFCPVCMLRKCLAGGVDSGESSVSEDTLKPMPDQPTQRFDHYELAMGEDGKPVELGRHGCYLQGARHQSALPCDAESDQ